MLTIWFLIPRGGAFPILLNLAGTIIGQLGISQYVAQLGEASSSNSLRVRLFSLSLIGTAFSWFSALPPNSVCSWNELEQKFHDHFYSGDNEAKLTDLT